MKELVIQSQSVSWVVSRGGHLKGQSTRFVLVVSLDMITMEGKSGIVTTIVKIPVERGK